MFRFDTVSFQHVLEPHTLFEGDHCGRKALRQVFVLLGLGEDQVILDRREQRFQDNDWIATQLLAVIGDSGDMPDRYPKTVRYQFAQQLNIRLRSPHAIARSGNRKSHGSHLRIKPGTLSPPR